MEANEVGSLKKLVGKLRKRIDQLEGMLRAVGKDFKWDGTEIEEEIEITTKEIKKGKGRCPTCGEKMAELEIKDNVLQACGYCGYRKKFKKGKE